MSEKTWLDKQWDYISNKDNHDKIFGTGSAFLGAIGINAIVQGFFNDEFDWRDLLSLASVAMAFTSGLGVVFVQEDAINKASDEYYDNDQTYLKYNKENLELSYKVRDYDYQRYFVKNLNDKELKELIDQLTIKRINTVKNEIYTIESTQFLLKNKKSIKKQKDKLQLLQNELVELETNGIPLNTVKFTPYQVDDIFNFNQEEIQYGRESIQDDSVKKHRKKNWLARFYMPVISTLLMGGAAALITQSLLPVLISSVGFAFMLIYIWWNTKRNHLKLKQKIATKREIKLNTQLNDAVNGYDEWKKEDPNEIPIDPMPLIGDEIKLDDSNEPVLCKEKGLEI
jgi:hypothetical protein